MSEHFFVGVDGGATKTIVRVENARGELLGQALAGPANIRLSVSQSWDAIQTALAAVLTPLALSLHNNSHHFHVGMGLAGCEVQTAYQAFLEQSPQFATLLVMSDAYTACLGAHAGRDGAIIIIGTGIVGLQIQHDTVQKVGGWGFPYDDEGSGAWIGLQAIKQTLYYLDGRKTASALTQSVLSYFNFNQKALLDFSHQTSPTQFARLAPLVIDAAKHHDAAALHILREAAQHVDAIANALLKSQPDARTPLSCALVGGLATFIQPHLSQALRARLQPALFTPEQGALLLVRQHLQTSAAHG
jgi:glucosamine kinase